MLRIIISFQNNIFPLVPKSFHHLPLIWGAFTTSPSNTIFKQIFKLRTVDFFYFTLANTLTVMSVYLILQFHFLASNSQNTKPWMLDFFQFLTSWICKVCSSQFYVLQTSISFRNLWMSFKEIFAPVLFSPLRFAFLVIGWNQIKTGQI